VANKGQYKVVNRAKYKGNPDNVIYRSSWEVKVMSRLDRDPNVVQWSSECIHIRYMDKTSGRSRAYIPDFWAKTRRADGTFQEMIIEVKPGKESPKHAPPPIKRKRQTEASFLREAMTWGRNKCKWAAAEAFCAAKGWAFVVLTERELGLTSPQAQHRTRAGTSRSTSPRS
jgi:hypothetical protein